jgi:signal peptidase I
MKTLLKKIPLTIITTILIIVFPFVVLTLISSRTSALFDTRSFIVQSGSMQPLFPVGSTVYAQQRSTYSVGEIITFLNDEKKNITHRIVATEQKDNQTFYITKGDANKTVDSAVVAKNQIIGKVFFYVPYLGIVTTYLKSPLYFIGFIVVPGLIFIGIELWNIKNEIVRMTEKRIRKELLSQT